MIPDEVKAILKSFRRVKSNLCTPWSRYLRMYTTNLCMCVCVYTQNLCVCMYVYPKSMCLCMCGCRIFMYLCMWPLLCISDFYVYRISNFLLWGPSFFIKIPFVKVVDFNAGEVMRGHGHFWWIYPLGARFRYGASLLDFHHAFGLIHKNISFC